MNQETRATVTRLIIQSAVDYAIGSFDRADTMIWWNVGAKRIGD